MHARLEQAQQAIRIEELKPYDVELPSYFRVHLPMSYDAQNAEWLTDSYIFSSARVAQIMEASVLMVLSAIDDLPEMQRPASTIEKMKGGA